MTDWAAETAGYIEKTVANIRERTVKPAHNITNYLVYGIVAAFLGAAIAAIVVTLLFRVLVILANLLPGPDDNAWMAWVALGGIFCTVGTVLWGKRGSL